MREFTQRHVSDCSSQFAHLSFCFWRRSPLVSHNFRQIGTEGADLDASVAQRAAGALPPADAWRGRRCGQAVAKGHPARRAPGARQPRAGGSPVLDALRAGRIDERVVEGPRASSVLERLDVAKGDAGQAATPGRDGPGGERVEHRAGGHPRHAGVSETRRAEPAPGEKGAPPRRR